MAVSGSFGAMDEGTGRSGGLGGCWTARWGPATSPAPSQVLRLILGCFHAHLPRTGSAGAPHGPCFIPGAAQAPRESRQLKAPSDKPRHGSGPGLQGGPRRAPGPAHGGVSPFPSPWPPRMGLHSRFPFCSTALGHFSPADPFSWWAAPRLALSLPGGLEAKEQGWGCPLVLPSSNLPWEAQSSLSSTLQTAAITTKQRRDMPMGPQEQNTSCKPERCERWLALQEEKKAGKKENQGISLLENSRIWAR